MNHYKQKQDFIKSQMISKFSLLFYLISILFFSCEKEEIIEPIENQTLVSATS